MKFTYLRTILVVITCIMLALGSIFWATSLMDSLFAYRSPLRLNPPAPGNALGESLTGRVVIVLVDALREDTSRNLEVMPFLNQLREQGAWAQMHSRPPSYSEPGYTVLLTGAWPDINDGPAMNLPYEVIPTFTQDNLFSAAYRSGLKTAISGYYWFEKLIPQDKVTASYYTPGEDQVADRAVVDAALPWLRDGDYQLVLIHLDQVDYAGHYEGGPRDPRWDQAARRVDDLMLEIVAELDLTQDTLLVISDHGQIDQGGHGGHEAITLLEPFILVGRGVKSGFYGELDMVDVAPTLAALLGVNIPAISQGAVKLDMFNYPNDYRQFLVDETQLQQARLLAAYQESIDAESLTELVPRRNPSSSLENIVDAYQDELSALREARLSGERMQRIFLGLILMLLPIIIMVRKRGRLVAWWIGGALLYILLFHLRYAIIDGNTYSLSWVTSAEGLINYVFLTSAMALGTSWLLVSFGTRLFWQQPSRAFEITIGLLLVMIYLTSLPILLSYALNGFVLTWTLPHFPSMFLAFLSVLQVTILAGVGLLLAVLSGTISRIFKRTQIG